MGFSMTIYLDFKRNYELSTIFTTILSKLLRELNLYSVAADLDSVDSRIASLVVGSMHRLFMRDYF